MLTWTGFTARPSTEGQKMKYLVLKSCFAAGEKRNVGDVIDLGEDEARSLLGYGRVSVAPAPKPEVKTVDRSAKPKTVRKKKSDED